MYEEIGDSFSMTKMACAWFRMCKNTDGQHITSYEFEIAKNAMAESLTGRKLSENHKKHIAEAGMGRIFSEDARRKISEARKGKKLTFTIWNKGKHLSDEIRKKLSEAFKGKTAWNKGCKSSEEQNKKHSLDMKGRHLWNNGIITVMTRECPGEDWVRGRLKK